MSIIRCPRCGCTNITAVWSAQTWGTGRPVIESCRGVDYIGYEDPRTEESYDHSINYLRCDNCRYEEGPEEFLEREEGDKEDGLSEKEKEYGITEVRNVGEGTNQSTGGAEGVGTG